MLTIAAIYLGMQLSVIPIFLAEISPTYLRGSIGTLYWLSIKVFNPLVYLGKNILTESEVWWITDNRDSESYFQKQRQQRLADSHWSDFCDSNDCNQLDLVRS